MLTGLELLTVGAAIAAIISAYKDAGEVVANVKRRRARRRAPAPNPLLEQTLSSAAETIRGVQEFGEVRFGDQWHDPTLESVLRDIELKFLRLVVHSLNRALEDDNFNDFHSIITSADFIKFEVVENIHQAVLRRVHGSSQTPYAQSDLPDMSSLSLHSPPQPSSPPQPPPIMLQYAVNSAGPVYYPLNPAPPQPYMSHEQRPHPYQTQTGRSLSEPYNNNFGPLPGPTDRSGQSDAREIAPTNPRSEEVRKKEHSGKHRHSVSYVRRADRALPPISRRSLEKRSSYHPPLSLHEPGMPSKENRRPSVRTEEERILNASTVWGDEANSIITPRNDSQASATSASGSTKSYNPLPRTEECEFPNTENNFQGFCLGAVRLQAGLRDGFTTSNAVQYLFPVKIDHCATCGFFRHLDANKVYIFIRGALQYRWKFLAKCHVPVIRSDASQYGYRCPFCAFAKQQVRVFGGVENFINHVASHHQGLSPMFRDRICYVNDKLADDDDSSWDVNLVPLKDRPALERKFRHLLERAQEKDKRDTTISYLPSREWLSYKTRRESS